MVPSQVLRDVLGAAAGNIVEEVIMQEKLWLKNWPEWLPRSVQFKRGEIPLFEYLRKDAEEFPDRVAINFFGKEVTYKELDTLSDRFATALADMGVNKGDRVALFMENCPQYVISHYGIHKAGATVVPCSPMFKEWELEYELGDSGAETIVSLDHLCPIVKNVKGNTKLRNIIVTSYWDYLPQTPTLPLHPSMELEKETFPDTVEFLELMAKYEPYPPKVEIELKEDLALLQYTAGTTGLPKGAMLTHYNALFKTATSGQLMSLILGEKLTALVVMPICHIAGMLVGVNVPIYIGGTTVMLPRFHLEAFVKAVDMYKCNVTYTAVPMAVVIMEYPDIVKYDLTSLSATLCSSFGMVLTDEISERWGKLTGAALSEASYGLTEDHTADTVKLPGAPARSVGLPTFDTEIKIVDFETGTKEVAPEEEGEILVRGPGVFKGYWNRPEATAEALKGGWLHTGDIGKIDKDGWFYFIGRIKDMLKCSGYSVFPEEVEDFLRRHPAVANAAVIGIPDPYRGESVKAFVVLKPEYRGKVTEEEIINWSKERMAAYKYPRAVEFRDELPVSGVGKVLKRVLKEESEARG